MNLSLISILAFALALPPVRGADAPPPLTVAVFDFGSPNRGPMIEYNLSVANTLISVNLSTNPDFIMVDRADIKNILGEQAMGASGIIKPDSAASIGQVTGAKVLVTGQLLMVSESTNLNARTMMIVANVIGTETGRVFTTKVEGVRSNELTLLSDLSEKIAQTIMSQRTNLIAGAVVTRDQRVSKIIEKIQGKQRPSVSLNIVEDIYGGTKDNKTAATELGLILQKAGFKVVDEASGKKSDVLITGTARAAGGKKTSGLFSAHASVEVKVAETATGNLLTLDRQESVAVDLGKQTAATEALENATDDLAERLLPLLAQ